MTGKECIHYCVGTHSASLLVKKITDDGEGHILVEFEDHIKLEFHNSWRKQFEKALKKKLMVSVNYHACITGAN
jgi:hypothetical protein